MPKPGRSPAATFVLAAVLGGAIAGGATLGGLLTPRGAAASAAPARVPLPLPTHPQPVPPVVAAIVPQMPRKPLFQLAAQTGRRYRDGRYTGPAENAYYGWVQVEAVIRAGRLAEIRVLRYPSDRVTSRRIAHIALPRLEREVIRAQSAYVHAVSGATLTSDAFRRSVNAALRRAAS